MAKSELSEMARTLIEKSVVDVDDDVDDNVDDYVYPPNFCFLLLEV
jgi:hypothetical protein